MSSLKIARTIFYYNQNLYVLNSECNYTALENPNTYLSNGNEWIKQYFKRISFNTNVNEKTAICFLSDDSTISFRRLESHDKKSCLLQNVCKNNQNSYAVQRSAVVFASLIVYNRPS